MRDRPIRVPSRSTSAAIASSVTWPPSSFSCVAAAARRRDGEPDHVEAEARIDRIGERIDPLAEQPGRDGGVSRRQSGLDREIAHRAVAAIEPRGKPPPAAAPLLQFERRLAHQFVEDDERLFCARDRLGEASLEQQGRQRAAWHDAAVGTAQQTVERTHHVLAEPRGERCGRPCREIADRLEPGATQRDHDVVVEPQRRDRQAADRAALVGGGHRLEARERLRRLGRTRDCLAHVDAGEREAAFDIVG